MFLSQLNRPIFRYEMRTAVIWKYEWELFLNPYKPDHRTFADVIKTFVQIDLRFR